MNVLDKAEKALEYLINAQGSAKRHELQTATATLGRCLGALGCRPNYSVHYANLLHSSIPTLLALASNDSAEVRLVGDEALNRAVVGGNAFHAHKTNIILQNQIDAKNARNARWIRAALARICLGDCWLRPGIGKIRAQAQTLIPKLTQIVRSTNEIQLIVEALESNLPRILNALAEYTSDEEFLDFVKALFQHVEANEPSVRRGVASSLAHICSHRESVLTQIISRVFEKLWPETSERNTIVGWFTVIKAVFQINAISKFTDDDNFTVQNYLELYQLCIYYIECSSGDHNIQNTVMECLTVLLSQAKGEFKRELLEKHPKMVNLDDRKTIKSHMRNISSVSAITSVISNMASSVLEDMSTADTSELTFSGALHLGSLSQLQTPMTSVEDLTIQTPDSPESDIEIPLPNGELTRQLSEKLEEIVESNSTEEEAHAELPQHDNILKVNIGSSTDDDIPLKYCARLLTSKFLLTGNKNGLIPDKNVRVSLKASALNCLSEILQHYPQAMTFYLDKDADVKCHNVSGSSVGTESIHDNINDFILERNICYQESLTDSLSQDLLNKSLESQTPNWHQQLYKKDSKSESTEQKSLKDVPSNILDSKIYHKNDLMTSGISADSTNQILTTSNFTTNSNMTGSNDLLSTDYPRSTSAEILSSSIDLDIKFDHFGESTMLLENQDSIKEDENTQEKHVLIRTDNVCVKDMPADDCIGTRIEECDYKNLKRDEVFEFQHMCDVFVLLEGHSDPQIRGLVRVCIGNYISAALDLSHGNYYRWRNFSMLPKDVNVNIATDKLVDIVLKGLSDDIHSCVNHTLAALTKVFTALSTSSHSDLIINILNALVVVEKNSYWLCKVNLCKLYEKLPYQRLYMLYPGCAYRSSLIMNTLYRLLGDQDQKVRNAAASSITSIIPNIYPNRTHSPSLLVTKLAKEHSENFQFGNLHLSLDLVRDMFFYYDLPNDLKNGDKMENMDNLKIIVSDLICKLMESSCKYYSEGLLVALHAVCGTFKPWFHMEVYCGQPIIEYCLDSIDYCNSSVTTKNMMLALCTMLYPVEIHKVMSNKASKDIFERDFQTNNRWQHLDDEKFANVAEKFLQITLKMLNILVHLVEEVNPNIHVNKSGIALPGSPVRRKTQDVTARKHSTTISDNPDEKSLKKKNHAIVSSLRANFVGHFFNDPLYMKLYENLRAIYSNYKINLDSKSSIFYEFLTTVLDALAIQLELSTEKEFGFVTEEILYYLKVLMPFRPDKSVYCISQLLKCLFTTNMISLYQDFMKIRDLPNESKKKTSFYDDVIAINALTPIGKVETSSRRSSVSSVVSQKLSLDTKNPIMMEERNYLIKMENFYKNRMDRNWGTNKKVLERYIRLFEPVVIQSLKSYAMQNDIPLQCKVLCLLNQLLTLRVNYCMLDSEQIFIGFLLKQLDMVEQHEIPNSCALVHNILLFLVHLSTSKHHSKQLIDIPKLIQLCDGLMASGAHSDCVSALRPVVVRVFCAMGATGTGLGRMQQQEAQATKEVLFYMMQKTMHDPKILDLVACVLSLSQDHPESYYRWSELASDTLLNLLSQRSIEIETKEDICYLEKLLDTIYRDVLLDQSRVEVLLKILFKAPPDQITTPYKVKLQYLVIIMVLLRKILIHIPESEILLSINYLKASHISPQSIFFNIKTDIDPLNVLNVNENCAHLSSDVILVRLLFKTLTYAILEIDNCNDGECTVLDAGNKNGDHKLLYLVCVNIICQVKHMLHLTTTSLFPLLAKTAQNILHNEQSGLNTGLYSPDENIPLDLLNLICLRSAHRIPLLTVHWSHLLIRLKFLEHKYWQNLLGFVRNLPLNGDSGDKGMMQVDVLQVGCFMAYCEYFVENGLSEVVHLTWLLVNRVHILVSYYHEPIVRSLIAKVQSNASASGLLLQAVAARCQTCLKDEFALNTFKILSKCHETQSGPLIFLICRVIGKLDRAVAIRFANLAIDKCRQLKEMPFDDINVQLSKEDLQVALELLQRDKVHVRYSALVVELNSLASSIFDLSPLDLTQDRAINPQYIITTNVDSSWLVNQIKSRCCGTAFSLYSNVEQEIELAILLSSLPEEDISTVLLCPEFDKKILRSCFKISSENYVKDFLNVLSVYEGKEIERERAKEQKELTRLKEEKMRLANNDNNILNVANPLQVFKKSDNKETKSQFFISIKGGKDSIEDKLGRLELTDIEPNILTAPDLPHLYLIAVAALDKSLSDVIRLFPKQNRPLSQSENFNLNIEQTMDRYTRKCHQIFQNKSFYREFCTIHRILTGFLEALHRLMAFLDDVDCDVTEHIVEMILPSTLAKNISVFTVISLQYTSFLIKNKKIVESPVHTDVSFRATAVNEKVVVDNVIRVALWNASKALTFSDVWMELNVESNFNRIQSAISCLFAVTKYFLNDTKPLKVKNYIKCSHESPKSDIILSCDKLLSLIEYWETNFYTHGCIQDDILAECYSKPIERLLVSLARLDVVCHVALIPPIEWPSVDVSVNQDVQKIELPLQALQDMDVLEPFLFRVNLIGWSSKKLFEEIWVGLLGALHGNGTHWAVRGISQLLVTTIPRVRREGIEEPVMMHLSRQYEDFRNGIQRMRNIIVGTSAYGKLFESVNLERIPLMNERCYDGCHYAQFNTDYLKVASDISDEASFRAKLCLKRTKRGTDIDVNSCLQLLMDVTTQMLHPKAPTGLSARCSLLSCIISISDLFSEVGQWCWLAQQLILLTAQEYKPLTQYSVANQNLLYGLSKCLSVLDGFDGLAELSMVHQKLLKSLSSSYAPLRQAALQGCLLQLTGRPARLASLQSQHNPYNELVSKLRDALSQYLNASHRISIYEQSLYWTVLFTLVQSGHSELMHIAVDFLLANPKHFCADLVIKGVTAMIRQQVLPKELKNTIIEKLLNNMKNYSEKHAMRVLMVHLFTADDKLLSPRLASEASNMDTDVLMNSMERITLLYKTLKMASLKESKFIIAATLKYFLRETLPPAATLSRVVIEFLESCREAEKHDLSVVAEREKLIQNSVLNAEVVFEVFQTAKSQDQLPVLSGWTFEALCHLLSGKVSPNLLPYCLLCLLTSASSNPNIRSLAPLTFYSIRFGFNTPQKNNATGIFDRFLFNNVTKMSFADRRLLCIVALHSNFSDHQLSKLKELCVENEWYEDLFKCLTVGQYT